MQLRSRTVTVEQLPESFSADKVGAFLAKLRMSMTVNRPCLVLDCSKVSQMNKPVIALILSCLEEAMKRNGDVRLAGVSEEARAGLASVGADRLFHIFASNADAESSFHRPFVFGEMLTHAQQDEAFERAA